MVGENIRYVFCVCRTLKLRKQDMFDMTFWIEFITLLPFVRYGGVIRRELTSKVRDMRNINFTVWLVLFYCRCFLFLTIKLFIKAHTSNQQQ